MLFGSSTNHILRMNISAAADVDFQGSIVVVSTASPPVGDGTNTTPVVSLNNTGTGNVTLVTGAASQVKRLADGTIRNAHASNTTTIRLERSIDGTNYAEVDQATLLPGESFAYNGAVWLHKDSNGAIYPSVGNAATQAEMEAGTATNKYVTPQGVNWHPGANKCWVKAGVTGNILNSWNVTSLTDNGTGDITVTIATDFSSVDYCANVSVEMTATTYGVANTREPHIRSGGQAVGTLRCDCVDNTATTSLIKDPTAWHISMLGDQ